MGDLTKVLNKKFRAMSTKERSARVVECILLYGTELPCDRHLRAVIPDFTGSSTRLIAKTKFIPNFVDVKVKTLTG